MNDDNKTREQLIEELAQARRKIAELENTASNLKKSENALRESTEKFLIHFSLANDVMFSYDNQFKILSVSPNVERILGYKPEELVGKSFPDLNLLHPEDLQRAVENALMILSGKAIYSTIMQFITKDGAKKFGELSSVPLIREGSVVGAISVARDVTERIELEKKYHEDAEKFLTHFSLTDDVLFSMDTQFRIMSVSPGVEKTLGYKPEELIGKSFPDLNLLHSDDMGKAVTDTMRIFSGEEILSSVYRFITKDGTRKFGEVKGVPFKRDGHIVGSISVARDITKRIELEKSLSDIEEKIKTYFTLSDDILFSYDNQLKVLNVSPNVERITGYKPEELIGRYFDDLKMLVPAEDLDEVMDNAQYVLSGKTPYSNIYRFITKNGAKKFAEVNGVPIMQDGKVVAMISMARDISERIQMVNTLRESEEKYRIHFSLANDVMFSYDKEFRVLSVSPNVERVLGYKPEEVLGRTFHEVNILHPDYMDEAVSNALRILSGETIYSSIYEFITKDGKRKFGEVSGVPLMRGGRAVAVITVARDITERIHMQESLQESEERYRITLQSIPDAVSILSINDSRYLYVNDGFSKITGYSVEETIGKTPFDLDLSVNPEDIDLCIKIIKDIEVVDSLEYRCRRKDGIILNTLLSVRPIQYDGEDCVVVVMRDITTLKQIAEEKKRLEIQSQKMESIGTLARGIAHDFNNILTTIIGYTKMSMKDILKLAKGREDLGVVHSDLNEVRRSAIRAKDLVNQILAFSRHAEKEYAPMDLSSSIKDSLKLLRTLFPANINTHENLAVSGLVMGDPHQIHQVMMNLCTNAVNAMGESGGDLEISIEKENIDDAAALDLDLLPGSYLKLAVSDTGRGMTPEIMRRIFDPYFTTKWKGHGTGLGLSIVHGIVKSHGGAITCKSKPGEGTTFMIYLPEIESVKEEAEHHTVIAGSTGSERILVLDEEPPPANPENKKKENLGVFGKPKNKQY